MNYIKIKINRLSLLKFINWIREKTSGAKLFLSIIIYFTSTTICKAQPLPPQNPNANPVPNSDIWWVIFIFPLLGILFLKKRKQLKVRS